MNGILLVNKPKGITSHDVVDQIRKLTKIKKVGHTGTLDPNASGLLVICIGEATKMIPYIESGNKVYNAVIKFGQKTTTDDSEGEIIEQKNIEELDLEGLDKVLKQYIGTIEQYPPIYSAKKVKGKKLYDYARKNHDVEIKPSTVHINDIEVLDDNSFPETITLLVDCSKGTYIRSLARDIGESLNNCAYLLELKRLETNTYKLEDSVKLEDLKSKEDILEKLLPIEETIKTLKQANVLEDSEKYLLNGNQLFNHEIKENLNDYELGETIALMLNGRLKGIGEKRANDGKIYIQPKKLIK